MYNGTQYIEISAYDNKIKFGNYQREALNSKLGRASALNKV